MPCWGSTVCSQSTGKCLPADWRAGFSKSNHDGDASMCCMWLCRRWHKHLSFSSHKKRTQTLRGAVGRGREIPNDLHCLPTSKARSFSLPICLASHPSPSGLISNPSALFLPFLASGVAVVGSVFIGDKGIFKSEVKLRLGSAMGTCRLMMDAIKDLDMGIFRRAAYDPA